MSHKLWQISGVSSSELAGQDLEGAVALLSRDVACAGAEVVVGRVFFSVAVWVRLVADLTRGVLGDGARRILQ